MLEGACPTGKRDFERKRAVKRARMKQLGHGGTDGSLQPYRCPYCDQWHLGHRRKPRLRVQERAEA